MRARAKDTPSPCCNAKLVAVSSVTRDGFYCVKCSKPYTFDEVLDTILDTAVKPKVSGGGPTSIGIDDDDDVLDHTDTVFVTYGTPKVTAPRPKMVPLSRTLKTYEVKEDLKALGARWDHINKQWMVPEDQFAVAHAIVQRGVAKKPGPPPFTTSKFAGLAPDDDLSFEDINTVSWQEYNDLRHRQEQQQARKAQADQTATTLQEVRTCWECGKHFNEPAVTDHGSWDDYWCGCEGR